MTGESPLTLDVLMFSRPGARAVNEDAGGFWSSDSACFCVLSDGAGGHGGGDVASRIAVREILNWFRARPECEPTAIHAALHAANQAVVREQSSDAQLADMRATVVVLAIDTARGIAAWGHLGDTRLYCWRQQRLIAQTRDHSVVQGMVDSGVIQAHELRSYPGRSRLLGALGDAEHFDPDVASQTFSVRAGDVFLLCTDGLWECVTEDDMQVLLGQAQSAQEWLQALESQVITRGRPGQDNYSALAVWCAEGGDATCPGLT